MATAWQSGYAPDSLHLQIPTRNTVLQNLLLKDPGAELKPCSRGWSPVDKGREPLDSCSPVSACEHAGRALWRYEVGSLPASFHVMHI